MHITSYITQIELYRIVISERIFRQAIRSVRYQYDMRSGILDVKSLERNVDRNVDRDLGISEFRHVALCTNRKAEVR